MASLETVVKQPETEKTESPQGAPVTTTETPKKTRKPRRTYAEVDPNPFNIVEETESYTRITQELRMISQEKDFQVTSPKNLQNHNIDYCINDI